MHSRYLEGGWKIITRCFSEFFYFFCVVPEVQSTKERKFVLHNYEITFPEGRILTELSEITPD